MALMFRRLFAAPEYRRPLLIMLVFQLFVLGAAIGWGLLQSDRVRRNERERAAALIGRLETGYPRAAQEAIDLLNHGWNENDIMKGTAILERYGFGESRMLDPYPLLTLLPLLILLTLSGTVLVYHRSRHPFFRSLDGLSAAVQANLEGEECRIISDHDEGEWAQFCCRFNQLVSQLFTASDAMRREQLFLERMLSDISHQLKTPMSSLVMFNDLMRGEPDMDPELRAEFLERSGASLDRMEKLVGSLLKLARLESGSVSYRRIPIELPEIIDKTISVVSAIAGERQVKVLTEISGVLAAGELPWMHGDPFWLSEAFANVLKNGIEHTPSGGRVFITVSRSPLFLRIIVQNEGEEIPEADLPRLFERFFSGSENRAGIGRALARQVVNDHGGDLRAENTAGEGVRFIFTFPD